MGSLNGATTTGAGTTVDLGLIRKRFVMNWTTTGNPSAVTINLEGTVNITDPGNPSINQGQNWVTLATATWPDPNNAAAQLAGKSFSPGGSVTALSGGVRYIRANLVTLSGGSSPTVTATVTVLGAGDTNG